jgi:OPA family glycerol-3-phosphate transporter-like MFS transporter
MPNWVKDLAPIFLLLLVVTIVMVRLPKVDLGHSDAFRRRRTLNWLPLGLTYAFLYMGRYNLTVSKNALGDLMSKADFGVIFAIGTVTYGISFVLNGPLTDRFGGRAAILVSAGGAAAMNALMGVATWGIVTKQEWAAGLPLVGVFSVLYAANMYFQSFGAVSIVKVNAAWFHVRERGVFGGIFGILISLGIYFAFDWGGFIVKNAPTWWVFFIPAAVLAVFFILDIFLVRDTPADAGQKDFDTADASSGDDGPRLGPLAVAKRMLANPVIVTIAAIEFCSGYLRNALMQWYIIFANETGIASTFVPKNWGMLLCCAGILGGVVAGVISDRVFDSRRGPVASFLYAGMLLGAVVMSFLLLSPLLGWTVIFMSLCIIGVHGMLSGTASMDFGGKKNVGVAVGLIDGCVYLGTGLQALLLGQILPAGDAAKSPGNWISWPVAMIPLSLLGLALATRVWNAKPKPKSVVTPATDVSKGAPEGTEIDTSKPAAKSVA